MKNAAQLLDDFCAAGIVIEVTHRSKRRLSGLAGLAPLREAVRPPYRPGPGRGRDRPCHHESCVPADGIAPPLPSVTPFDRPAFDYSGLAQWMTHMEQTIRRTRRTLGSLLSAERLPPKPDG